MQHRQIIAVTVGGPLLGLGGAGLIGLTLSDRHLDANGWFGIMIAASITVLLVGLYLLLAPFLGLPLPNTRSGFLWPLGKRNRSLRVSHPVAMATSYEYGRPELADHLAEIQTIARRLVQGGLGRPDLAFGPDPERERHMLASHFPKTVEPLRRWSELHHKLSEADDAVRERAQSVEAGMGGKVTGLWSALHDAAWVRATGGGPSHPWIQPSVRAENGRILVASLRNQQPTVVAYYADEAEREALLRRIQEAVNGVGGWRETRDWEKAWQEAARARHNLSEALGEIQHTHVLRGQCHYC